jgi:hypothetical protein
MAQGEIVKLESELNALIAERDSVRNEADALRAKARQLAQGGDREGAAALRAEVERLEDRIGQISTRIGEVNTEIDRLKTTETQTQPTEAGPTTSAATDAQSSQSPNPAAEPPKQVTANGDVVTPPPVTAPTNADVPVTRQSGAADTNTDPPTKTLAETQATNGVNQDGQAIGFGVRTEDGALSNLRRNPETGELYDPGGIPSASANTDPGVGANDDNPPPSVEQSEIDANAKDVTTKRLVQPQPNVLDNFASYTYQISVYLFTPEQFNQFASSRKKLINNYFLLFQSGGAAKNIGGPQGNLAGTTQTYFENDGSQSNTAVLPGINSPDAGRNPFFPNDFYIDQLTLENVVGAGGNNGSPHQTSTLKFTVIEPSNITLIDRIYEAVQDIAPKDFTGKINYAAAEYLMVIRFYGYTIDGKLVAGKKSADPNNSLSDSNAIVEKYIPFKINNIKWGVTGKLVHYEFDCTGAHNAVATSQRRGTIPFDIEVSGGTVKEVLGGGIQYVNKPPPADNPGAATTADENQSAAETARLNRQANPSQNANTPPPPKANSAPQPTIKTIKQGLLKALNDIQDELVKKGIYEQADRYVIQFANDAKDIENGTITKPSATKNKQTAPMGQAASQNTQSASPDKQQVDNTQRNVSVKAGTQVVQALDTIIRNSSYITNQAITVIDETTNQPVPNPKANTDNMYWFRILMTTRQLDYDKKRNDYAYEITYTICRYAVSEMFSPYFPIGRFPGIHKSYPWWFTGVNTAVLDYSAEFNKAYNLTISGNEQGQYALDLKKQTFSSMRDVPFLHYYARSNQSSQGSDSKANELAASAAEYLYNVSDTANSKITILGDPAWISQGSIAGIDSASLNNEPFEPDGTINFDTQDVLYEVAWQRPEDYDLNTGLADPFARTLKTFGDRQPRQSVLYKARKVISEFKMGKFTQIIDAVQYTLPMPNEKNKAPTAPPATSNTKDTARPPKQSATPARSGPGWVGAGGTEISPGGAATGNPTLTNQTRLGNPNIRPGSLRERAAQANAARAAQYGQNGATPVPETSGPATGTNQSGQFPPAPPAPKDTATATPPPQPPTSNGENVSWLDRALNRLAGQDPATGARLANQATPGNAPAKPQTSSREY